MNFRTDLALERREILGEQHSEGIKSEEERKGNVVITRIEVLDKNAERAIGKPMGKYVTVEVPPFSQDAEVFDSRLEILADELRELLPESGSVLVVGLGNMAITPDALGPKSAGYVLATRHIGKELAKAIGFENMRAVCEISPGVLGQTGIETAEIITGIVKSIKPGAVIIIDALASRSLSRLGCTVQMSDTGISPGSGVGNARTKIDRATLGTEVVSIGVPTVVDGATLAFDLIGNGVEGNDRQRIKELISPSGEQMMVTPKEIDLLIERASKLVGMAINRALQPDMDSEDIISLVT